MTDRLGGELGAEDWAGLFDAAPCGLLRLDADHAIEVANAYAARLLDAPAEQLCGRKFFSLLSVAGRIFAQTRLLPELALSGRVEELAIDLVKPDGSRAPVLLNASRRLDSAGRPGGVLIAFWRATGKRAPMVEAPRAQEAARVAARAKSDFLANVSHEIRTPLNGMIGVAGVLALTSLDERQREMLEVIQSSGATLERLVSDILEISKLEAGRLELDPHPFDLQAELGGVVTLARLRAEDKGLGFASRFGPRASGWFSGDAIRLKQVLGNLTSNAVKFTAKGEVRVEVDVTGEGDGTTLVLTVTDTGIGFDETVGDTLFQRFHQADAGITRAYGGTGLGLSICKALIDLMGGSIHVRSRPGEGSRFQVRAPLPAAEAPGATAAPEPASSGPDTNLRILLVEDHLTNQMVVRLMLEPYGVDLTVADDGALGLEAWRRGAFDVVLMDLQMPVMDGLTATRAIRAEEAQRPGRPRTPIVVLSANAMNHHRREALEAGADLHVTKPLTPESLLAGLEAALALGSARAAA